MENEIEELKKKINDIKSKGWIASEKNYYGSAGNLLENLLGLENQNFQIPDYKGIEIKTKHIKSYTESYLTLFNATPDSYIFETKRLLETYGYPNKKYPQFKSFKMSVYVNNYYKLNHKLFKLKINYELKQVILQVYDLNKNLIDDDTRWSFEMLKSVLERKFSYLCLVKVQKSFSDNKVSFKYVDDAYYKLKDFNTFLVLLSKGLIRISFNIDVFTGNYRYGQVHDRGTGFEIKEKNIDRLFKKI